jgi:hypothetical protein
MPPWPLSRPATASDAASLTEALPLDTDGARHRHHPPAPPARPPTVTTRKPVNREVFEGSDLISLRLRAAKKPAIITLLELLPDEIDFEPVTIEPMTISEIEEVTPIEPLIVPASEIIPFEEGDDDDVTFELPPASPAKPATPPTAPATDIGGLPLFGVGWVDTSPARKSAPN